jgi:signal transduction histidine kinase
MTLYGPDRSSGKAILILFGAAILFFTVWYSVMLASAFRDMEQKRVVLQSKAIEAAKTPDESNFYNLLYFIQDSLSIPFILEGETGQLTGYNFTPEKLNTDSLFLQKTKEKYLQSGTRPIIGKDYYKYIYYLESPYLDYIRYFPVILALLVGIYILLGYLMFNAFKKSEQSKVWAGMAKETAHQLGTPISALLFGLENMKESLEDPDAMALTLDSMGKYVEKLELVADRFSKIGSVPVLETTPLFDVLDDVRIYMQELTPARVVFEFKPPDETYYVLLNKHLFSWVIENLINNSLNAMDGKGTISCSLRKEKESIEVWISDTGSGISPKNLKKIFLPGYSTKKRGWGLGLSLAKRIIEEYHKGKIWVKESIPYERTTFVISLPLQSA